MPGITQQTLEPITEPAPLIVKRGWRKIFRALSNRNFRLFVSGQLVSLLGTWMQQMAMSWLLYRLTHSPFALGLMSFVSNGPGFIISPLAGGLADRLDRRKLLVITQSLAMVQALILAALTLSGHVQVWQLFCLGAFTGVITGVDTPVRQAFVMDLLEDRRDLSNAISLNASVFNGARLVGPALAGLAIALWGEGWCFLLNGLSYIAVILALLSMRLQASPPVVHTNGYWASLKEGVAYVYRTPALRNILGLVALVSLVGLPYSVLVPVYVRTVLHGGPDTLGYLMGSVGAGALVGALYLASRPDAIGLERLIYRAPMLFGLSLVAYSQSHTLWLSMGLSFLLGLGMMLQLASSNILLQTLAEESKRGRVMSLYAMSFLGMTPIGGLLIGTMATHLGLTPTLILGGILCLVGSAVFAWELSRGNLFPQNIDDPKSEKP
jgi:MFS family permease